MVCQPGKIRKRPGLTKVEEAEMLNLGTSGATLEVLFATGLKMAAASLISSVCAILGGYTCAALSAQVGKDIRMALYEKSLKLSIYDFRSIASFLVWSEPLHLVIKTGYVRKATTANGEHLSHVHINGSFKWYFSIIRFSRAS
ncbi:hypothetical protein [Faecalibacterium sp. An121]|uniref:hypothetical protein n=1 Tax=Faecalibacterium sp. An121 TaxID=1965550 RepID=UPI0019D2BBFE|nr:hypothetical protein [Faecalibacterium sp. An121]